MAIKIPSKNIYEMNNPKVRDNVIDNVSVEQTVVTPSNEYETPVHQYEGSEFDVGTLKTRARIKYEANTLSGVVGQYNYALSASFVQLQTTYTKSINVNIEKLLKNAYISKIYDKKNYQGENNIKFTVFQKVTKQDVYMYIDIPNGIQNSGEQSFTPGSIVVSKTSITDGTNAISSDYVKNNIVQVIQDTNASVSLSDASISNSISETNKENISTITFNSPSDKDAFTATGILVLAGLSATKMFYQYTSGGVAGLAPTSPIKLNGTREIYKPERIELTIYGDTIGIDITDGSITYGSGNKPHLLSGNELLQDSTKTKFIEEVQITHIVQPSVLWDIHILPIGNSKINVGDKILYNGNYYDILYDKNAFKDFYFVVSAYPEDLSIGKKEFTILKSFLVARNALSQYEKGKETATLLCDISDYYDENGEKVIDTKTKKMSFRLHDEVIPYVFGADGQDQPMSKYQDGSPKVFEVIGSNIIYDGAVWQELTLLEKN